MAVAVAREPAIPVPDVSGQDQAAAQAALAAAGFQVTPAPTASADVPVGNVIGTDPPAGTPLPRNTAVSLLVSTGPDLVTVPSTVGQTRAAAEALLHDSLGFGLQETLVNAGPTRSGQVITQSPNGGQQQKGSTIALTIGQ